MCGQIPDILYYNGKTYEVKEEPLKDRLESFVRQPPPDDEGIWIPATNNDRGYQAEWLLFDSKLFFTGLISRGFDDPDADAKGVFPDHDGPVFAHWYSGPLTCGGGQFLGRVDSWRYVHSERATLQIDQGRLVSHRVRHMSEAEFDVIEQFDQISIDTMSLGDTLKKKLNSSGCYGILGLAECKGEALAQRCDLTTDELRHVRTALMIRGLEFGLEL